MSAVSLNWRSIASSNSPKFLVKGTVLASALAGVNSRFLIEEVRCYGADGFADRNYRIRDAHMVSDADVKAGKLSPIVGTFDDYNKALAFIDNA